MANQQQIAQKYQTAFQEIERQQGRIAETRMQGDKLYVLGYVSSEDAKNKVWDRIKQIDPNYSDLICDIRVGQDQGQVHQEFDRVAQSASPASLAQGLSQAFRSGQTPPFSQMVAHLFGNSDGQQRAGFLNHLLSVTPGGLASEVLGMVGGKRQVTPEQAQQVKPEQVQQLAAKAEQQDPSIVDRVSEFYAQHPGLIKTLGVGALTVAVSHLVHRRSGGGA